MNTLDRSQQEHGVSRQLRLLDPDDGDPIDDAFRLEQLRQTEKAFDASLELRNRAVGQRLQIEAQWNKFGLRACYVALALWTILSSVGVIFVCVGLVDLRDLVSGSGGTFGAFGAAFAGCRWLVRRSSTSSDAEQAE